MSKKRELARNTLILGFGRLFTGLSGLLLLPVYTFFLDPSDYGTVDLAITYVALLVPAITIQFGMAAFRFLVDTRGDNKQKTHILSNILYAVLLLTSLFSLLAISIHAWIDIPYFWYILAFVVMSIFSSVLLQVARGLGDNKKFAIASIITGITALLTTVALLIFAGMGIEGAFIALIAANSLCVLYLAVSLSLGKYIALGEYSRETQKNLRRYSLPLVPNGIALWAINASDRTIIVLMIDVAANGIYAVASRIALALGSLSGVLTMSWTEAVSLHINAKDRDKFISETFNSGIAILASIGLLITAGAPLIFDYAIGDQYSEALNLIPILVVGVVLSSVMSLYGAIYVAKKLTKQVATTSIAAAVINIVLTVLLVPLFGLYGAATGTAVAYLAVVIFRHYSLKKHVTLSYDIKKLATIASLYLMALPVYTLNNLYLNVAVLIILTILIYMINRSDVKLIISKVFARISKKSA